MQQAHWKNTHSSTQNCFHKMKQDILLNDINKRKLLTNSQAFYSLCSSFGILTRLGCPTLGSKTADR